MIVADHGGRMIGWAAAGEDNPRECYRASARRPFM
jgi:hypothetical protein